MKGPTGVGKTELAKSLAESLSLMSYRIPSLAINNIILNMEQSNLFGNSIIDTMHNQLNFLKLYLLVL